MQSFEQGELAQFYARMVRGIRQHDTSGLILREHNYFGNLGVPALFPPLEDGNWVYSPHGYDLVVDTEAMPLASDQRIDTIFRRAAETQARVGAPVICGEWGAFASHEGIERHARYQLERFDELGWSWMYWCWEPGFENSEAARVLEAHLK